jgi:hypothetical protein
VAIKSAPRAVFWTGGALVGALTLATAIIIVKGPTLSGVGIGLRLTARFSYIFFWLAYVGGALTTLFGPVFDIVGRRVRELGLAFASAQLVHIGLVTWLAWLSQPESLSDAVMPFFAIAVIWTYLLAFLSTKYARRTFDCHTLNILRALGSEYIALTFFADFVLLPKYPVQFPVFLYVPFWVLLLAGPLLRIAAAAKRFRRPTATAPS